MKRVKEVPQDLLDFMESRRQPTAAQFNKLNIFCTYPVRAVKMKILRFREDNEAFCTVIIPAVDVYVTENAMLKKGFLKRDAVSYFVSGTHKAFPYGHVYRDSGYVCLGNIFVPSAVPERSSAMPLETLFLHNDRNLSHGNSHLSIDDAMEKEIFKCMAENGIKCTRLSRKVESKNDIIANDEIWNLAADVAEQKPLPEALAIMSSVYGIVFREERRKEEEKRRQEELKALEGNQAQNAEETDREEEE